MHHQHPEVSRLVAHAGTDGASKAYFPAVKDFLEVMIQRGHDLVSDDELDRLVMKFFDELCYEKEAGKHKGANLFFGLTAACPETNGVFKRTNRAWKTWEKIAPGGEGAPIPEEIVFLAAKRFLQMGEVWNAWLVFTSYDGYLRSQDWDHLCGREVVSDRRSCALMLGPSERGLEAKAGPDQGVVVHKGSVADGLVALEGLNDLNAQLFLISPTRMRNIHAEYRWKKKKM